MRNDAIAVEITADRQETARPVAARPRGAVAAAAGKRSDDGQHPSAEPPGRAGPERLGARMAQFSQQQAGAGLAQADAGSFGKQGQAGREHKTLNQRQTADDEISSAGANGSLYV